MSKCLFCASADRHEDKLWCSPLCRWEYFAHQQDWETIHQSRRANERYMSWDYYGHSVRRLAREYLKDVPFARYMQ